MKNLNLQQRHAGGTVERAEAALRARGTSKPPLTLLEAEVLARVALRLDPWRGPGRTGTWGRTGTGSRTVSQALGRLRRKGYILGRLAAPVATVSPEGEHALEITFRWALYNRVQP